MSWSLRLCLIPLAAALHLGCSAGSESKAVAGDGSGGSSNGGTGFGGALTSVGDAALSSFSVHVEQNGVTVQSVTLPCAGGCVDVQAVATGGYAPYTFTWEDGSTTATRHACASSTTTYQVSATDTGATSGEFSRPPETVTAPLTAAVLGCSPDAGSPDAGTCPLPIDGTYTGSYTTSDLAGLQGGTMTMKVTKGAGSHVSGSVEFDLVGVLHAEFPLDGDLNCATGELVLRGVSSDAAPNLCACGGRPWVFTPTYDAAGQTLIGDWAYHSVTSTATPPVSPPPPAPHEKAVLPVGDNGDISLKRTGP